MSNMFQYNTHSIKTLNLSNFDTSKVTNMERMFYNTLDLETVIVSDKFIIAPAATDMFTNSGISGIN